MNFVIRSIQPEDNPAMAMIIRTVMPEFGAGGEGFAIHDVEVDNLFESYNNSQCAYFVCELNGKLVGGGGVAPLAGGDATTCELKKMYFLKEARGKGLGKQVLARCTQRAREMGYKQFYLETFNTMHEAIALYDRSGFKKMSHALGNTGHFACDVFYMMELV